MMKTEGTHRKSLIKQCLLAVFGLNEINMRFTVAVTIISSIVDRFQFFLLERVYSRGGPIVTKSGSDDEISEKSRDARKYYRCKHRIARWTGVKPRRHRIQETLDFGLRRLRLALCASGGDNVRHEAIPSVSHFGDA
ncbi:hypothetical protein EVAR_71168_1 [Eumeta japonica]|uniref:Uncharacterized protein n=1 Tax=Eumeta variegata TaxID=151549 RepID=A0A4C1ZMF3_EUMVA|nr:hypothetical protein EVAR_71168_1 [Eumeta japonica]